MHNVQIADRLYQEAVRRARQAGYDSVDAFVADRLETDFADENDNFDDRFTPEVLVQLDRIAEEMAAGKCVSKKEMSEHLADVRATWLKNHAD